MFIYKLHKEPIKEQLATYYYSVMQNLVELDSCPFPSSKTSIFHHKELKRLFAKVALGKEHTDDLGFYTNIHEKSITELYTHEQHTDSSHMDTVESKKMEFKLEHLLIELIHMN